MIATALAFAVTALGASLLEGAYLMPHRLRHRAPLATAMMLGLVLALFLLWFAVSWRPVFSATASLITLAIVAFISNFKYDVLLEPLSFADFLLVPQIFRHPDLYYADFLRRWWFWLGVAALLGVIAVWFAIEPTVLPRGFWPDTALLLVGAVVAIGFTTGLFLAGRAPVLGEALRRLAPRPQVPADTAHFGFFGATAIQIARWAATPPGRETPAPGAPHPRWPAPAPMRRTAPSIVVIQSESFFDLAEAGFPGEVLPVIAEARARAIAHGRLTVPTEGAWTMRTEYSFLTGRPLAQFAFDALDPYLRAAFQPPQTIAQRLREDGYATHFVHPFDIRFFQRDRIVPILGFDAAIGSEAFAPTDTYGYYLSDRALGEKVLEVVPGPGPDFVFGVSMENHNPWKRGRIPEIPDPVHQYRRHLRNADAMLGMLIAELDRRDRDTLLLFYGDHVPIMRALAHPFPDPRTHYVLLRCGRSVGPASPRRFDTGVEALAGMLLDAAREG